MLRADAMMDTAQPGFEVGKYEMSDGHELFGNLWIAPFRDGYMDIAVLGEPGVAAPIICDDSGARCHDAFHEAAERIGAPVRHQGKPDPSGIAATASRIELGAGLSLPYLDCGSDEGLMVNASTLSARTPAHPGFIGLNVFFRFSADTVLVGAHHADAELMKDLEGGLVARQSELPLELDGRHAGRLAGDEVSRPEPYRERRVRALHDCASGKAGVATARAASENAGSIGKAIRLIGHAAVTAHEPLAPAGVFKIGSASGFIWKEALEFRQRARERQIISLKRVDRHGCSRVMQMLNILPVAVSGDNRISTVCIMQAFEVAPKTRVERRASPRAASDYQYSEATNVIYLREFPIALPPLPEQRAIAHILGTLDDKIELNRRMNETLEAMARSLIQVVVRGLRPRPRQGRRPRPRPAQASRRPTSAGSRLAK